MMTAIKERIIGALTIMDNQTAEQVWAYIQTLYSPQIWDTFPEVEATEDEIAALEAYNNGDPEYQPTYTHEQVLKELGLQ